MSTKDPSGSMTLLVSNQSFDINPVDITITIDGQVSVQDDFDVQGDQPPQHNWRRYTLQLKDGPHDLVAESKQGKAQLHASFSQAGVKTITIAYWYDRRKALGKPGGHFTVELGPGQTATM